MIAQFTCQVCSKVWEAKRPNATYCSRKCLRKAENKRIMEKRRTMDVRFIGGEDYCVICSEVFILKGRKSTKCEKCRVEHRTLTINASRRTEDFKAKKRQKLATDPRYALDRRMSCALRLSITNGQKNGRVWESFVDYSLTGLMIHLERQFTEGMSWANMAEWHVDHIVPKASFNYTSPDDDDFRAAWALTNLRPLWAKENIRKSKKVLFLI